MLINYVNILTELSLYLLLAGIIFSNSIVEIFAISTVGFFIIRRIVLKDFRIPKTPLNLPLYLLCIIIFITFLRSAYFSESIRGFLRIIKYTLLYFALIDFFKSDEKRINRAFWVFIAVACVAFLDGIFQSVYGFDLFRHKDIIRDEALRRIQGAFTHPNDFGAYIIFILPMTLCFFDKLMKKNQRIFLLFNCLIGCYCLLKTSSRGAWLGFLIGIMVYFFFYRKQISVVVPFAILLFIALSPHGFDRVVSLFMLERNTVWERTQLWEGTWNMVKVHPFLGFGINTFSQYFSQYKPASYPDLRYTHNSYLQMWSEIGILGLSAFLSIIFITLKDSIRGIKAKLAAGVNGFILLGLIAGYIAFLIQSGLDTNLFSLRLSTLFWIVTAYLVSINATLEKKP